eukprot:3138079-Amphidinium_carterae.1
MNAGMIAKESFGHRLEAELARLRDLSRQGHSPHASHDGVLARLTLEVEELAGRAAGLSASS